ncbi:hypothetical protein V6V47_06275 [Micromonospora sp. CPCC 205539]|uniref:hypothetical protein n=1 Tax=Micromonospora sp. CPCC 205539 TaxID=3122408 RepID=UPI002FEE71BC
MAEALPIPQQGDRSGGPAVIELGADESAPRGRFGSFLTDLAHDPRVPLLLAGLGAVAGVASLIGEWLVMTIPEDGPAGARMIQIPVGVSEVGGLGIGYLVGLLGLVCSVALATRGSAAVRSNARLVGLTLTGAVLALLVAQAATLDDPSQRNFFYALQEGFQVEYGRGLVMAFAACVLLGVALRLVPAAANGVRVGAAGDDDRAGDDVAGRGWRRRDRGPGEPDGRGGPADLTVAPAVPFARPDPSV